MKRVIFAVCTLLALSLLPQYAAAAPKKKPPPAVPLTIKFTGGGSLQMTIVSDTNAGPSDCVLTSEDKTQTFTGLAWRSVWQKVHPATGSFGASTHKIVASATATGEDELNLVSCHDFMNGIHFLGQNGCKPGQICKTPITCSGTVSGLDKSLAALKLAGIPAKQSGRPKRAFTASISESRAATANCAAEVFNHWFYSNAKPLPGRPLDLIIKITPAPGSESQTIPFKRKGHINCAPEEIKAISGSDYYSCALYYQLSGKVVITGPYHGKLERVEPYD